MCIQVSGRRARGASGKGWRGIRGTGKRYVEMGDKADAQQGTGMKPEWSHLCFLEEVPRLKWTEDLMDLGEI